jgi:glutamyl-tRNA synthetase
LIYSTFRQKALSQALQWSCPSWLHVPLVIGADGRRLAKRHGDSRLSSYRGLGVSAQKILGYIGGSLGLIDRIEPIDASELLRIAKTDLSWVHRIPRWPLIFDGAFHELTFRQ